MHELKRLFAMVLVFAGIAAALSACDNTIRGIGQDIRDTADAVEDSVQ